MIPAGRVHLGKFEALFQEVCGYMPDGYGVSSTHFVSAIGHFYQYLDTNHLDVDADPMDSELMKKYGLGFANYVYDNNVDISLPPSSTGRLSERRLGLHRTRPKSPKEDEQLEVNSDDRETDGGLSQFGMSVDDEEFSPVNLFSKGPPPQDPRGSSAAMRKILREASASDDVDLLAGTRLSQAFTGGGGDRGHPSEPPGSAPGRMSGRTTIPRQTRPTGGSEDAILKEVRGLAALVRGLSVQVNEMGDQMGVLDGRVSRVLCEQERTQQRLDQAESHRETTDEFMLHLHKMYSTKSSPMGGPVQKTSPSSQLQPSPTLPSSHPPTRSDPYAERVQELQAYITDKSSAMGRSLCHDWCNGIPSEVILCVVDIYVGDGHDPTNQPVSDLVYMHRANHKLSLTSVSNFDGLQRLVDLSKQQIREHLESLALKWAAFELKTYQSERDAGNTPAPPRLPRELEATPFFLGVKEYYQSYYDLVSALARFYREYEQTPEAWRMLKEVSQKLLADRSACARRGGTTAASTAQRAEELMGMFDVTLNFTRQRLDKNSCFKVTDPPMWLREHLREADIAYRNATLKTPQPLPTQFTTPPQNTTTLATGGKLTFKRCYDIFRKTFNGLSGFPHAKQNFKGTNKLYDTGCAGCGSLEHNYEQCPAQAMTKTQARDILLGIGRQAGNSQALTNARTSVTEFVAAVEKVYN